MEGGQTPLVKSPSSYQLADLLLIEAVTHLHVGVGRGLGAVDLPVQKDENGFPCIYSSSLKGALKTAVLWAFLEKLKNAERARRAVEVLLGPEPRSEEALEAEEAFESSAALLDACLVAMPVRSLRGVYAYVTSPYLLGVLLSYIELLSAKAGGFSQCAGQSSAKELYKDLKNLLKEAEQLNPGKCVCVDGGLCHRGCDSLRVSELGGKIVLLEEFWLESVKVLGQSKLFCELGLDKPLLVLHDDDAREVVNRGLVRLARVGLKRETKTVERGPWTEEYVPMKSRFATVALYKKPPLSETLAVKLAKPEEGEKEGEKSEESKKGDEAYVSALQKLGLLTEDDGKRVWEKLLQSDVVGASEVVAGSVRKALLDSLERLSWYVIAGGHETIGKGIMKLRVVGGGR